MDTNKYEVIKNRLKGPVFPILTPFCANGDVDYDAVDKYVKFLLKAGAKNLMVTVGTSRFNLLTGNEMMRINEVVVESAGGNALTIVSGPGPFSGSTRENIRFAKHAESIGADAIMLVYPERWYGDEPVIDFFHDVSKSSDIGIMIHAVPMRNGFGGVKCLKYIDADMIEKIAQDKKVVGVKEENGDRAVYEEIMQRLKDRLAIIGAGGVKRRFLIDSKFGADTYLVGIGSFKPELSIEFYESVMSGNIERAEEIAEKYEDPYFEFAVQNGWHRVLKETLDKLEVMPSFERAPFNRISDDVSGELSGIMKKCGWIQ